MCMHTPILEVEKIPWQNWHIIAVIVAMLILYCTRGICVGIMGMVDCIDKCISKEYCICCPVDGVVRLFLDFYVGMNPLILVVVYMLAGQATPARESSVIFPALYLNNSSLYYSGSKTPKAFPIVMSLDLGRSSVSEIDYIFFVMPFSLSMACSYVILFRSISVGNLTIDTPWDSELVCGDTSVLSYEIAYHIELLCMNISLIMAANTEQSAVALGYCALSLTLLETYFVISSRTQDSSAHENQISLFAVVLFMLVLAPVALSIQSCVPGIAAGILFIFCSVVVSLGHYSCFGNAQAKHVVVLRLVVSIIAATLHIFVLAFGRNRMCT